MALQSETSRIQYNGNNSTTASYAVPFYFFENSHIKAVVTNSSGVDTALSLGSGFSLTGAGNVTGGTLTTTTAVPSSSKITIYREVPATQTTSYAEGGDFPAASHERALDKLTMLGQQLLRSVGKSLRFSETVTNASAELPKPQANHVIGWTSAATGLQNFNFGRVDALESTTATHTTQISTLDNRLDTAEPKLSALESTSGDFVDQLEQLTGTVNGLNQVTSNLNIPIDLGFINQTGGEKILMLRKGTQAQHQNYIGPLAEVTVDTTRKSLRVHDGVTAGGFEVGGKQPAGAQTYYLSVRTDGVAGSGSQNDPFDVSTPTKWRTVLLSLPNYCTIRLLAGTYNICGLGSNAQDSVVFPDGCSVIGDGMHNTILRVTEMSPNIPAGVRSYVAISITGNRQGNQGVPHLLYPRVKFSIVSDLTVDCNWQTFRAPNYKSGAIGIDGSEMSVIRRCRVINFGGHGGTGQEAFPVYVNGENSLVEECVIEQPVAGTGETEVYATYILLGSGLAGWQQIRRTITANHTNNTFSQQQLYNNNEPFVFTEITGGAPLVANKIYYVVNATNGGSVFQLSETPNGTPINFDAVTSASGSGLSTQYQSTVRGCICRGQSPNLRDGFGVCLGSPMTNLVIENNVFENLAQGIYGDSWFTGTLHITQNLFRNNRTNIRTLMGLEQYPQIAQIVVENNKFEGFGVYTSGNEGNKNILGGWSLRTSNAKIVVFQHNRIDCKDGLPITEATPVIFSSEQIIYKNNWIHSLCYRSGNNVSGQVIQENNINEIGVCRFDMPMTGDTLRLSPNGGDVETFTASASTNIVTMLAVTNFIEGDFVYVNNLQGGSGLTDGGRYFVRNLITNAATNLQSFQLYTQQTGGSPVAITANYTSGRASNVACRNGLSFRAAMIAIGNACYDKINKYFTGDIRPALLVEGGIYEWDDTNAAPVLGNAPVNGRFVTLNAPISIETGVKTINVGTPVWGSLQIGRTIAVHDQANYGRMMYGILQSYNNATGNIVINVTEVYGTGSLTNIAVAQEQVKPQIIGIGNNHSVVLRSFNGITMWNGYGNVGAFHIENLTLAAWGPNGAAIANGWGKQTLKNVKFTTGNGATKVVANGNNLIGWKSEFINCESDKLMYDPALNQGAAYMCYFENCKFTYGCPPNSQGSVFVNCVIETPTFLSIDSGEMRNCVFSTSQYAADNGGELYIGNGAKIVNTVIRDKTIRLVSNGAQIENTTIRKASGNCINGDHSVDVANVYSNRPVDPETTITKQLSIL